MGDESTPSGDFPSQPFFTETSLSVFRFWVSDPLATSDLEAALNSLGPTSRPGFSWSPGGLWSATTVKIMVDRCLKEYVQESKPPTKNFNWSLLCFRGRFFWLREYRKLSQIFGTDQMIWINREPVAGWHILGMICCMSTQPDSHLDVRAAAAVEDPHAAYPLRWNCQKTNGERAQVYVRFCLKIRYLEMHPPVIDYYPIEIAGDAQSWTSFIFHVWIVGLPSSPLAAMFLFCVLALHEIQARPSGKRWPQDAGHLPWKIYTPSVKHVKQCNAKIIHVPKFFSWVFFNFYLFIVIFHSHLQLAHRCSEKSPDLLLTSRKANPGRFYACAWPSITMTDGPCTMLGMFLFLGMVNDGDQNPKPIDLIKHHETHGVATYTLRVPPVIEHG